MITMITLNNSNSTNNVDIVTFDATINPQEDKAQENNRLCYFLLNICRFIATMVDILWYSDKCYWLQTLT